MKNQANIDEQKSPYVSIIMSTYNRANLLPRAIESVLNQTYKNFEFIIVDDASPDNTEEVVRQYQKKDGRIIYLKNQSNSKIQITLNNGLRAAKGKYIARIDDDDEWIDPQKLEKQLAFFKKHPDCVLVGIGVIVVDEEDEELFRYLLPETDEKIRKKIFYKNCFIHSGVVFKKDAAMKFNGYDESEKVRHIEDYNLWLKLGTVGKLANLPIYGVKFTLRSGNISSKNKVEQFKKDINLIKKFRPYYPNYFGALIRSYLRLIFYGVFNFLPLKSKILKFYKEHY